MFKGQVDFATRIIDAHVSFPLFSSASPLPGVESLELACTSGDGLVATVQIARTASAEAGIALAKDALELALSRVAYFCGAVIESARLTGSQFEPIDPAHGYRLLAGTGRIELTGYPPRIVRGVSTDTLKGQLESPAAPADTNYGQLRSARLSVGPVEEFMHLYAILLGLLGDSQPKVDAFIRLIEPGVQQSASPIRAAASETVYTRLRNELAHKRAGVSIESTKVEMAAELGGIRRIVCQAIARYS